MFWKSLLARFARESRGGTAVVVAIGAVPIIIAIGAAAEFTSAQQAKTRLQGATDAAVLAAAHVASAQRASIAGNVLTAELSSALGLTNVSPAWTTNSDGSFTGNVSADIQAPLTALIGQSSLTVHVASTAAGAGSGTSVCALVLDPASAQSLLVNSNVTINGSSCEIDVASTGNPAAIFNSGDSFSMAKICVAGSNVTQNGGSIAILQTGCAVQADPFASTLPTESVGGCSVSNQNYTGVNTLYPGTYCGNFNFNGTGTLNLNPGLYVFSGAHWNLNSGWTVSGTGVTFYYADSNSYIQINSGVTLNASAPTSGTFSGILMFEPPGLATSSYTIDGSSGHALNGLIYQPSRNITFNSQSNLTAENITLVVNQLILNTLTWNIAPEPSHKISASGSSMSAGMASPYLAR